MSLTRDFKLTVVERVRREPGWHVIEMATGHDPMVSDPQGLSRHLLTVWGQAK